MQYYDKKAVGERIRNCRRDKGLTQCELAERLDYASERQLQRIESGETSCSVDKLMEIAQVLGVSTDFLLFGREKQKGVCGYLAGKTEKQAEFLNRLMETVLDNLALLQD
jgi:transcriptional regulator with XRE-family HTH domain